MAIPSGFISDLTRFCQHNETIENYISKDINDNSCFTARKTCRLSNFQ